MPHRGLQGGRGPGPGTGGGMPRENSAACSLYAIRLPLGDGPARGQPEGKPPLRLPLHGAVSCWLEDRALRGRRTKGWGCACRRPSHRVLVRRLGDDSAAGGGRQPPARTWEPCLLAGHECPVRTAWGHAAHFSPEASGRLTALTAGIIPTARRRVTPCPRGPGAASCLPTAGPPGCVGTYSLRGRARNSASCRSGPTRGASVGSRET